MVANVRTTLEIPDGLLAEALRTAEDQGTTLSALVEAGLRRVITARSAEGFRLRRATFGGQGLQPGVRDGHDADIGRFPALTVRNPLVG
jgi:Arc/MetJ family transcription regulator